MKLCQICKKREATIFLNVYENKKMIKDAGICPKCMEQFGFPTDPDFSMNKLLNKLKTLAYNTYDEEESIEIYRCRHCGLSQSEFDYDISLGCPKCYKYFADSLDDVIQRMHKSLRHIGKKSVGLHAKNEKIQLLSRQLSEEINLEHYENAAIIRDEITRVEKD
jgi:protein arginine kinase activator